MSQNARNIIFFSCELYETVPLLSSKRAGLLNLPLRRNFLEQKQQSKQQYFCTVAVKFSKTRNGNPFKKKFLPCLFCKFRFENSNSNSLKKNFSPWRRIFFFREQQQQFAKKMFYRLLLQISLQKATATAIQSKKMVSRLCCKFL